MSAATWSSIRGGLLGLAVGLASELIRAALHERRSAADMAVMVATMVVIGVVAPRLRNRRDGSGRARDEGARLD
ncbi:hypothetical protein GCM10009596_30570 [Arthrobacter rhombi]|uniref:hypothetical protein n=1 Tax=Arthrobacter rhombi TaxID=71253 RepID=UPI0031E2AA81